MAVMSDEMTTKFLTAAITTLRENVVPAIESPEARLHADQVSRVLYMLHARFSRRGDDLQDLLDGDQALLGQIEALVGKGDAPLIPDFDAPFSRVDEMEQQVYATELEINEKLPALLEICKGNGPEKSRALASLQRVLTLQKDFLAAQDPDSLKGSFVCYQGGKISEERQIPLPQGCGMELNGPNLEAYLQGRFPGAKVEAFSVMAGGFSKSTLFFTLVHPDGQKERLVIRKDPPTPHVSPISLEYPRLCKLYEIGFPVAEPLWVEDDAAIFDGSFLVSRRVNGTTDISSWAGDPESVEAFARQLAKVMADLHALNLSQVGFSGDCIDASAGELTAQEIVRWQQDLHDSRQEAKPLCEFALAWLMANIPASAFERRGCFVHGDIGFHNMMVENGRVTALLDWEFSHPGDPVEDLIYVRPFIDKVMDWETFKSYYYEYGGTRCTEEEEFYYTIWAKTRNPVSAVPGAKVFKDNSFDNVAYANACYILARYLETEAVEAILERLAS